MKDNEFNKLASWGSIEAAWESKLNRRQWIDSEPKLKLNLLPDNRLTDEEYFKMRKEVREIMELNMVMYGKW